LSWQDKQAAPVSVPLCEQCHGQIRLSNSFPGYSLLAASYLHTFAFSEQGYWRHPEQTPYATFEVWVGKTSKQSQSLCLCSSSAMGRWGWATAFQASPFCLPALCRHSHSQSWSAGGTRLGTPKIRLNF